MTQEETDLLNKINGRISKINSDMKKYLITESDISSSDYFMIKKIAILEIAVETIQEVLLKVSK